MVWSHTGPFLLGAATSVTMVPGGDVGITVLTNGEPHGIAAATGLSPMEYVHTLRLEEAKQMLEAGDLPIEAVANEVGYEDASFLGRLFRARWD